MDINEKAYSFGSKRSVIRELSEIAKQRAAEIGADNVFDFSIGNPSVEPPKAVSKAIKDLLRTQDPMALHSYTSAQGDPGARRAVAFSINRKHGLALTPDNIYMTCGAMASVAICLKAVLSQGDECVVFAPFFTEYTLLIESAGGKVVVSNPKPDMQIDLDDLKSKITPNTRAVLLNSPNNPSGVVYPSSAIRRLAKILKQKEEKYGKSIYLISDEPYRELVYDGVKVPYVMNYYDNSMVCYSFSKTLSLPGERIGYVAVNPNMNNGKDVYLAICGAGRMLGYVCAPSLFQHVIAKCIDAKVNVKPYKDNRDLLYDALTEYGYECVKPNGAFYLFVKSLESDAVKFSQRALEKNILVVPCDDFGVSGFVRIAYCVSSDTITRALPKFKELFDEYKA